MESAMNAPPLSSSDPPWVANTRDFPPKRQISSIPHGGSFSAILARPANRGASPVIVGEEGDSVLLGSVSLESLGLESENAGSQSPTHASKRRDDEAAAELREGLVRYRRGFCNRPSRIVDLAIRTSDEWSSFARNFCDSRVGTTCAN